MESFHAGARKDGDACATLAPARIHTDGPADSESL